jgi:hypothetical protein
MDTFMPADITRCYNSNNLGIPSGSLGPYFASLLTRRNCLKNSHGYRLESSARAALQKAHGQAPTTMQITALLASLPTQCRRWPSVRISTRPSPALRPARRGRRSP